MLTISQILTLIAIGSDFMVTDYKYKENDASHFVTLPYLVAAFTFVPLGLLSDRYGYRMYIIIFGGVCMIASYIIFIIWDGCP